MDALKAMLGVDADSHGARTLPPLTRSDLDSLQVRLPLHTRVHEHFEHFGGACAFNSAPVQAYAFSIRATCCVCPFVPCALRPPRRLSMTTIHLP